MVWGREEKISKDVYCLLWRKRHTNIIYCPFFHFYPTVCMKFCTILTYIDKIKCFITYYTVPVLKDSNFFQGVKVFYSSIDFFGTDFTELDYVDFDYWYLKLIWNNVSRQATASTRDKNSFIKVEIFTLIFKIFCVFFQENLPMCTTVYKKSISKYY